MTERAPSLENILGLGPKLPVFETVGEAFNLTFGNIVTAFAMSWKWLLLVLIPGAVLPALLIFALAHTLPAEVVEGETVAGDQSQSLIGMDLWFLLGFVPLFVIVLMVVALASIAVNWHRFVLRREMATGLTQLRLDGPVWRYLAIWLLILVAFTAPLLLAIKLSGLLLQTDTNSIHHAVYLGAAAMAFVLGAIVAMRLAVVLPGVALGNPAARLSTAWNATRGHSLRLLAIAIVIFVAGTLISAAVALFFGMIFVSGATTGESPLAMVIVMQAVMQLPRLLILIVGLSAMSIAYRFFYERPTAP